MTQDYIAVIADELKLHGVRSWDLDVHHKHPQIHFEWNGRSMMFVVPNTPSDSRGHLNALSDVRRMMGVRRRIYKSSRVPKARNRTSVFLSFPTEFTVRPNPLDGLAPAAEIARRRMVDARQNGQSAFLSGLCGSAPAQYAAHLAHEFLIGWWLGHSGSFA